MSNNVVVGLEYARPDTITILYAPPGYGKTFVSAKMFISNFDPRRYSRILFLEPNHNAVLQVFSYALMFQQKTGVKTIYYLGVEKHCPIAMDDETYSECVKDYYCKWKIRKIEEAFGEKIDKLREKYRRGYPLSYFCRRCPLNNREKAWRMLKSRYFTGIYIPYEVLLIHGIDDVVERLEGRNMFFNPRDEDSYNKYVCPRTVYFLYRKNTNPRTRRRIEYFIDNAVITAPHSIYSIDFFYMARSVVVVDEFDSFVHTPDPISWYSSSEVEEIIEDAIELYSLAGKTFGVKYFREKREKIAKLLGVDTIHDVIEKYTSRKPDLGLTLTSKTIHELLGNKTPKFYNKLVEVADENGFGEKLRKIKWLVNTVRTIRRLVDKIGAVKLFLALSEETGRPAVYTYGIKKALLEKPSAYIIGLTATLPLIIKNRIRLKGIDIYDIDKYGKKVEIVKPVETDKPRLKLHSYPVINYENNRFTARSFKLSLEIIYHRVTRSDVLVITQNKDYSRYVSRRVSKQLQIDTVEKRDWGYIIYLEQSPHRIYVTWLRSRLSRGVDIDGFFKTVLLYGNIYPRPSVYLPSIIYYSSPLYEKAKTEPLLSLAVEEYGEGALYTPIHESYLSLNEFYQSLLRTYRANKRRGYNGYIDVFVPTTMLQLLRIYKPYYIMYN